MSGMSELGEFRDMSGYSDGYLDVYPNTQNGRSDKVVIWARDSIRGARGASCPISLDPHQALTFGQKTAAIAQAILDGTDWSPQDAPSPQDAQ